MSSNRFLFINGVVSPSSDTPSVSTFLESHQGAYTTTRTHNNASLILFWERHLRRLSNSATILFDSNPKLLFKPGNSMDSFSSPFTRSSRWESVIQSLVNDSMRKVLPVALKERKSGEELSITSLVSGNWEKVSEIEDGDEEEEMISRGFDVYVHVGMYVPRLFGIRENGAHLAVVGRGRDVANAKYTDWVRLRKSLEKLRPPSATELLLSNNGDQILEGCVTNVFVVCRKEHNDNSDDARRRGMHDYSTYPFEIQTAPIRDGVLPGVIRQVIIDICLSNGIPLREVAPSWSKHESWEEAFITSSLRLLQHVETIQAPSSWKLLESKSWKDVTWEEKQFKKEIMKKVGVEGYAIA
ncbi:uncharacterized protein LOC114319475 isoform X2 [Camellia sinensis]|uniref:uncharacterized protein LOC114319475 isoform X2 n=1 Tax=Camellia sinensis TaxID=4442 RepID=UPI00103586E9|nr:uncharacterized protein LOC114319475 isoform X2 [Camellia sinensis]XP_028122300.1 uncharacterized protein LOC114319475 isoform X2 [Camellia sinensis]